MTVIRNKFDTSCAACGATLPQGSKVRYYGARKVYCFGDHLNSTKEKPMATIDNDRQSVCVIVSPHGEVRSYHVSPHTVSMLFTMLENNGKRQDTGSLDKPKVNIADLKKPDDKPEPRKTYRLTGSKTDKAISNGDSWKDSEVKSDPFAALAAELAG